MSNVVAFVASVREPAPTREPEPDSMSVQLSHHRRELAQRIGELDALIADLLRQRVDISGNLVRLDQAMATLAAMQPPQGFA